MHSDTHWSCGAPRQNPRLPIIHEFEFTLDDLNEALVEVLSGGESNGQT